MKNKILITGAAGFIGSSLANKLALDEKNEVYCLDNYFTGNISSLSTNVKHLPGSTNNIFKLVSFKPDIVYHLGEYSRISTSFEDIDTVWNYNVNGTYQVIKFCKEKKCKLIYAGSSSKFGNCGEDENLSPYSWIKAKNVELIKNFNKWFGLEYAIVYFYNVYGPGQLSNGKYATVIGIFEEQLKNNKPVTVVKPGTQKRYFTHINDSVNGLIAVGQNGNGDGYCLSDDNSLYSIEEVARMFSNNIEYLPEQKGNREDPAIPFRRCEEELGWNTKFSLQDYIEQIKKEKDYA
jgi:UDP-glucose 4-epimerase